MFSHFSLGNVCLKLFQSESKCKFTPKVMAAQLPSFLVLAYCVP